MVRANKERMSMIHATGKSPDTYTKKVVRIENRDNRGYTIMREKAKGEGFLVLDSSYTQAGDPNTMRNFGFPRNIIYNFEPVSELSRNDP